MSQHRKVFFLANILVFVEKYISLTFRLQFFSMNTDVENETPDETLISVCYLNSTIGFAVFKENTNSIFADSICTSISSVEESFFQLKSFFTPTLFVLHPKIVTNKSLLESILCGTDGTPNYYHFVSLKSSCWNVDLSTELIQNKLIVKSCVECDGEMYTRISSSAKKTSNLMWISSVLNMESPQLCQALGALLVHLQQHWFNMDEGIVRITSIQGYNLNSYMRLDDGSFK